MRVRSEPGFILRSDEPRYYVRWLEPWEYGWKHGHRWEVRLLDANGHAGASIEFGPNDPPESLRIPELAIPVAVIQALRSGGVSGYVCESGRSLNSRGEELFQSISAAPGS